MLKNNEGIALMFVLILLVLVGGLSMVLLNAGVFNIRFGEDEVSEISAFYAAEAGIEYLRNESNNKSFNDLRNFEVVEKSIDDNNRSFSLEVLDSESTDENIVFSSTGSYNGLSRNININYSLGGSEKNFQMEYGGDPDDVLQGAKSKELYAEGEGDVYIGPNINPPRSYWFDDYENHYLDYNIFTASQGSGKSDDFEDDYDDFLDNLQEKPKEELNIDDYYTAFIETSGNQDVNNFNYDGDLINTILVVDGDINLGPDTKIENSIVVSTGKVHFQGVPNHDIFNSLFFIYQHELEYDPNLQLSGTGSDEWSYGLPNMDEILDKDLADLLTDPRFVDWRPSR